MGKKWINMSQICAQTYSHLTINPSHLSLLGELPSNLKILLLQHTQDRYMSTRAFSLSTVCQTHTSPRVSSGPICYTGSQSVIL